MATPPSRGGKQEGKQVGTQIHADLQRFAQIRISIIDLIGILPQEPQRYSFDI
jgi:hypothetical protein